jgi:anti-sigma factor RsiW
MNHPSHEEWVAYLYDELPRPARRQLAGHLDQCPECLRLVAGWQQAAASLETWALPARGRAVGLWQPAVKWGLAAILLVGLGLGAGRLTAPRADLNQLRAELLPALRQQLGRELKAELQPSYATAQAGLAKELRAQLAGDLEAFAGRSLAASRVDTQRLLDGLAQTWASAREEDRRFSLALFDQAERQRKADLAWLRRDLETVAVFADARLEDTQRELGQLASYPQAAPGQLYDRTVPVNNQLIERKPQ